MCWKIVNEIVKIYLYSQFDYNMKKSKLKKEKSSEKQLSNPKQQDLEKQEDQKQTPHQIHETF